MNARTVILAFLAGRAPGAYAEGAIAQRVNASGLLDAPVASVNSELAYLASERMGRLVGCDVHPVSKETVWYATDAGIRQWQIDGRTHVS